MKQNKKRIGFVSYWGFGRGQAYLTLAHVKMLQDKYDIYILKQYLNPISEEFTLKNISEKEPFGDVMVNIQPDVKEGQTYEEAMEEAYKNKTLGGIHITENAEYEIPPETFKKWVKDNELDVVVWNEYNQWGGSVKHLTKIAKELGCKTYAWLTLEKFKKEQADDYDRVISTTLTMSRFMRGKRARNFEHIPFSIDLNEFPHPNEKKYPKNEKFTFFHPGGWGGVHNRKNTDIVIEAFKLLDRNDTKLLITSQKPLNKENLPDNVEIIDKELDRKELIDLYYKTDATVLPSKWESIGIPILESMAAGTPVITSNVPPMNEFVRDCMNGYTCTGQMKQYHDISVYAIEVSPEELKKKMELMLNEMTYGIMSKNSRHVIETIYDLEKNKKIFVDFLKEELE